MGTTLVSDMHKVGIKACIIMHIGNNLSTDVAVYKRAGAHGVVGKGKNLKDMIAMIYRSFLDCQQIDWLRFPTLLKRIARETVACA